MIYTYKTLNTYSNILVLPDEIWSNHPVIPDLMVSTFGRILAKSRTIYSKNQFGDFKHKVSDKILKANPDTSGYPQIAFLTKNHRVHRLVAETFLNPPSLEILKEYEKLTSQIVFVNHKDKDILNANYLNLEWCTPSYNNSYFSERVARKGEEHYNTKLTEENVLDILELLKTTKMSQEKIAKLFNVKQITISNIKTGRSWTHLTKFEKIIAPSRKTVKTLELSST